VGEVQLFFATAGVDDTDLLQIIQLARQNSYSPTITREEFDCILRLIAMQQKGLPLSRERAAASPVPLIPHFVAFDPFAGQWCA
jgi:hypothetical protein